MLFEKVLLAFPTFIQVFLNPFSTFTHTNNPRLNLSARRAADSPLGVQAPILASESFRFNKRLGVVMKEGDNAGISVASVSSVATCFVE